MSDNELLDREVEQDTEGDQELTKEERLESARKKYEELKKKKKKGKKKKKDKQSDTPEPTPEPEVIEGEGEGEGEGEDKPEDTTKAEGEGKEDKEDKEDQEDQEDQEVKEVKEVKPEEPEESEEPEAKTDDVKAPAPEADDKIASKSTLDETPSKETVTEILETEPIKVESTVEEVQTSEQNSILPPASDSQDVNSQPDTPTETIESLKLIIAQHEKTIKKLRDENTDLKLQKMDLTDQIHALQANDGTHDTVSPLSPKKLVPAKPIYTKNEYASSNHEINTTDFRERLMVWKNWQVNMVSWNSTYLSEKIQL